MKDVNMDGVHTIAYAPLAPDVGSGRSYHLNSARTLLMLLGIPYHAALLFQKEVLWFASVSSNSPVAKSIIALIHIFRMPAFFLISGYFAATALQNRTITNWLRERYLTIIPPFVFGVLILHPVQVIIPGLIVDDGIAVTMRGKSIGHLWFLLALLGITTLVALFRKVLPRTRHLSSLTLASAAFAGVTISIGCATLMRDWVAGSELPLSATFNSMIWGISYGLPYFLIGMVMVKRHDVVEILTPTSPVTFLIIAVLTIAYVAFMPLEVDTLASTIAAGLLAIPLTTSLLLACSKYLSFQSDKIDLMAKSSFTVYLVHHPIIVILGVLSANLALPWYIHYAGICILTWVMSFGIWYAVRDIPVANVLFGAKSLARKNVSFRWRKEPRQSKEAAWPISSGHGTIA